MYFVAFLVKNLLRRKVRTALTCFGIAVAIGTTIALLGISDGFERDTVKSFEVRGVDIVVMERNNPDQLSSSLSQSWVQQVGEIPGVERVAPGLIELVDVDMHGSTGSVLIQGWETDSFLFDKFEPIAGRNHLIRGDTFVALLGKNAAAKLEKTVGDSILIDDQSFEIVGVYDSFSVFENGAIVVPLPVFQKLRHREGEVTGFSVVLARKADGTLASNVGDVIENVNNLTNSEGRRVMSAQDVKRYVKESQHIQMAHAMALLTSVIAIIVGAIGMLNTMIMSVVERVKEISILRAIGWRKSRVVGMIVGESLLLSLIGAIIGAIGAVLLARWLTQLPQVSGFISGEISPVVIAEGFLMALGVGLVGGSYPAIRAAYLLPSEGLRHE